jgi:nitrite reductase/ring-hydroxylating ferredoxin subunit
MKYALCKVDEIPNQGSKLVDFFGRQVHVYKVNGVPKAVSNTCMHFGGPLDYQDGKLVCPWHNSVFAMDDGHCLAGPAPSKSRLMFLSTRIEDGTLNYVWGE